MNNSSIINRLLLLVLPEKSASTKEDTMYWQILLIQLFNSNTAKVFSIPYFSQYNSNGFSIMKYNYIIIRFVFYTQKKSTIIRIHIGQIMFEESRGRNKGKEKREGEGRERDWDLEPFGVM